MEPRTYLIWSIEHNAWWKPCKNGYTKLRLEAGKYDFAEALEIVEQANKYRGNNDCPNEAMISA